MMDVGLAGLVGWDYLGMHPRGTILGPRRSLQGLLRGTLRQ